MWPTLLPAVQFYSCFYDLCFSLAVILLQGLVKNKNLSLEKYVNFLKLFSLRNYFLNVFKALFTLYFLDSVTL